MVERDLVALMVGGATPQESMADVVFTRLQRYTDRDLPLSSDQIPELINLLDIDDLTLNIKNRWTVEMQDLCVIKTVIKKSLAVVNGIRDLCHVHLDRQPAVHMLDFLFLKFLRLALLGKLEEVVKYQTNFIFCKLTRQKEFPEVTHLCGDAPGYLCGGWFWRFLKLLCVRKLVSEVVGFAKAILDLKRAALAISGYKIGLSRKKHRKNMTGAEYNPPVADLKVSTWVYTRPEVFDLLKENVGRIVEYVYKGQTLEKATKIPSLSGHFGCSKASGGAQGRFFRDLALTFHYRLQWMFYNCSKNETVSAFVRYDSEDVNSLCYQNALELGITTPMGVHLVSSRCPEASVYSICEPFKARIITAGDPYLYHLARQLQQPMHGLMRRKPCLALIGEPHTQEFVTTYLRGAVLEDDEFWIAGDYTAATDGMHPELCLEYIRSSIVTLGMSRSDADVLLMSMMGHKLKYNSIVDWCFDDGPKEIQVQQTWGQLMGSPSSFLALSAINLAIILTSIEIFAEGEILDIDECMKEFRVLVNGDDLLMKGNLEFYECWKYVAACAGLNPSMGKNFLSREFCNINSTCYWVNLKDSKVTYCQEIFSLNSGLVKGQGRVLGYDNIGSISTLDAKKNSPAADQLAKCLRGSTTDQRLKIVDLFFRYNRERLEKSHRSWRLPRVLGGLGLPFGAPPNYGQRKLAGAIMMDNIPFKLRIALEREVIDSLGDAVSFGNELHAKLGHTWVPGTVMFPDDSFTLFDMDFSTSRWVSEEDPLFSQYFLGDTLVIKKDLTRSSIREVLKHPFVHAIGDELIHKLNVEPYTWVAGHWSDSIFG
jgi:hypothetical protein